MVHNRKIQKLKKKIAVSRRKLQELWDAKGHTDTAVLEASIELDRLINLYQKQEKVCSGI
ncbi:MAG: aspartyl-phosphate phosphatase Spo0E family protein [Firmicutes bacterium]|nr:aspartyl-phosphate phosphatase Spo0E family protein [Bacillota bacterium]